jgi:hypothetical protein
MPKPLVLILCIVISAPASALEGPLGFLDLRAGYGFAAHDDVDLRGDDLDTDHHWYDARRAFLGAVWSRGLGPVGGLVVAGSAVFDRLRIDEGGNELTYDSVIGHAGIGYGLDLLVVRIEAIPFIGLGSADLSLDDGDGRGDSSFALEYGLDLNVLRRLAVFEVGVGLEYLFSDSDHDLSVGGVEVETGVDRSALIVSLVMGLHL